ncbi:MAG: GNAT family N-acetyltransferase [Thiohalomonadales bacterium]
MGITLAKSDSEIERCFEVMSQLRTHLVKDAFLTTVRQMESQGYRLAYIEYQASIVAVAGYRIYTNLFMGKHLYVDDLVTRNHVRSQGYGERMVQWLRNEALKEKCNYFHLDSGTHRNDAHKFYFKQGFSIASFHFSEKLTD